MTGITHPLPELVSLLEAAPEPHALLDQHYRILVTNAAYREHAKGEGSRSLVRWRSAGNPASASVYCICTTRRTERNTSASS